MNPFEFVIAIIAIVTIGNVIRARHAGRLGDDGRRGIRGYGMRVGLGRFGGDDRDDEGLADENRRLREEMQQLKERVKVLERITVDKENSLAREIEDLRGR